VPTNDFQDSHQTGSIEERRLRWQQIAFRIQAILLVLVVAVMSVVSWQFNAKNKELIKSNLDLANKLALDEAQFKQQQDAFVVLATQAAFELRTAANSGLTGKELKSRLRADSDKELENAIRADKSSWLAWREEAQAMIEEHQAQHTLDELLKAPIDKADGYNLFTEAMLQCAVGQSAAAHELVAEAQKSSDKPSPAEVSALNSACR
jgi:hypothetical protein